VGSLPGEVEQHLSNLLDEISEMGNIEEPLKILKAAAYVHLAFENIHPFADGNGRVGRTMTNYFLMTHKHPPLVVYDDDRTEYYAGLERYDAHEDIEPLFEFFQRQLEKTWEKALARYEKSLGQ
jgi:Fic family protein